MSTLTAQMWKFHPEEYLAIRADWVDKNPKATKALLKGLMEAQQWCDQPENRPELIQIVSGRNFFNIPPTILEPPFAGKYEMGDGKPAINDFKMGPLYWKDDIRKLGLVPTFLPTPRVVLKPSSMVLNLIRLILKPISTASRLSASKG
ncbi:ABC transporter substrate-binding protein [Trichothermofontia sichuanensis B231]|uniref:ABC transporter substrate-binding protein n=1 Tax=Trichothermofontia sichuanensis TaxID=3045816 RepID=UPI002247E934|nr:ABC transporter substrate-binding protein [Trichothermofontia sichuanensis B231]